MRRAMIDTVDEVGRAAAGRGHRLRLRRAAARSPSRAPRVQLASARAEVDGGRATSGSTRCSLLGTETVRERFGRAERDRRDIHDPSARASSPAKLVRGLAARRRARGATIYERTEVLDPGPTAASDDRRRRHTANRARRDRRERDRGLRFARSRQVGRRILPLYSLMIATEPLSDAVWDAHRHRARPDLHRLPAPADLRPAHGRQPVRVRRPRRALSPGAAPSGPRYDRVAAVTRPPAARRSSTSSRRRRMRGSRTDWGGPLGVPRDWHASVGFDAARREAWAGGYVGDGLSTTNLAGRTLADLITGAADRADLARLGEPSLTALGAGAAAVRGRQRRTRRDAVRRRRGARHTSPVGRRPSHAPAHRPLTGTPQRQAPTPRVDRRTLRDDSRTAGG